MVVLEWNTLGQNEEMQSKSKVVWYSGKLDFHTITRFGPELMLRKEASKSKVGRQRNGKRKETSVRT
jgi:hypothetical protein